MKKIFSNSQEVCHIYASQSQSEGKAGNIFFENESIFSYGKHFEICRYYQKENCFLFTVRNYSNSTAKHKNHVSRAISHKKVFHVPSLDAIHETNIDFYINSIKENVCKALKARENASCFQLQAESLKREVKDYIKAFNLALIDKSQADFLNNEIFTQAEKLKIVEKQAKAEKQREVKRENQRKLWEAREAERLLDNKEKCLLWRKGQLKTSLPYDLPVMLRIKNGMIETSKNAKVDLLEGKKLFEAVKSGQDVCGYKIGVYTVEKIENDIIKIGCHNIPLSEAEKLFAEV
jgi:hypothetical protein